MAWRTQRVSSSTSCVAPGTSSRAGADTPGVSQPDPQPTSFLTLEPGTSVVDRFGQSVGAVERVLLLDGDGFDGIVVDTPAGRRFVDAP